MKHSISQPLLLVLAALAQAACGAPTDTDGGTSGDAPACPEGEACATTCPGGEGLQVGAAWPMGGRCPGRTSQSPFVGPSGPAVDWASAGFFHSPAIGADGTIYVANLALTALSPDGTKQWSFATEPGVAACGAPAIAKDGTLYASFVNGDLVALASADGAKKWSLTLPFSPCASPAIGPDGTVYLGSADMANGRVYAVGPDGKVRWERELGSDAATSPALGVDGTVYASVGVDAEAQASLHALDAATGDTLWSFSSNAPGFRFSEPTVAADGTIFVGDAGAGDGAALHAISNAGAELWAAKTEGGASTAAAVGADGAVYVGSASGKLYAVNADGSSRWEFSAPTAVTSSPAVDADGTVYVGTTGGALFAVSKDGTRAWEMAQNLADGVVLRATNLAPAIAADGTLFAGVTGYEGVLVAFGR